MNTTDKKTNGTNGIDVAQVRKVVEEHQTLASGVVGGSIILVVGYFIFAALFSPTSLSQVSVVSSDSLLGGVSDTFTQLISVQGTLSFKGVDIINNARVKALHDFTEDIISSGSGRDYPFMPYVTTGSSY